MRVHFTCQRKSEFTQGQERRKDKYRMRGSQYKPRSCWEGPDEALSQWEMTEELLSPCLCKSITQATSSARAERAPRLTFLLSQWDASSPVVSGYWRHPSRCHSNHAVLSPGFSRTVCCLAGLSLVLSAAQHSRCSISVR